ncbi:DUF6349 family protein [Streptomyces sp. NPDC051561]|uniref:DUF6349 family protein n=1 Tax=Streptomyces sp. NPDC051561 TaxID=3365658 RepID=UPI0037AC49FF
MITTPEPQGARARQTRYFRARNAGLRYLKVWHIELGHPGGEYSDVGHHLTPPDRHEPTLLTRVLNERTDEFRGACLRCEWEGKPYAGTGWKEGANEAIEEAHDHVFPGWRDLPAMPRPKGRWDMADGQRLLHQITRLYPEGWAEDGGPLLVWPAPRREPHEPPRVNHARYTIGVARPAKNQAGPGTETAEQKVLF